MSEEEVDHQIEEAVEGRAWLLDESLLSRPGFDEIEHRANCNLHPTYRANNPNAAHVCDCGALRTWREGPR